MIYKRTLFHTECKIIHIHVLINIRRYDLRFKNQDWNNRGVNSRGLNTKNERIKTK